MGSSIINSDLLQLILENCIIRDIVRCLRVCKTWKDNIMRKEIQVVRRIMLQDFPSSRKCKDEVTFRDLNVYYQTKERSQNEVYEKCFERISLPQIRGNVDQVPLQKNGHLVHIEEIENKLILGYNITYSILNRALCVPGSNIATIGTITTLDNSYVYVKAIAKSVIKSDNIHGYDYKTRILEFQNGSRIIFITPIALTSLFMPSEESTYVCTLGIERSYIDLFIICFPKTMAMNYYLLGEMMQYIEKWNSDIFLLDVVGDSKRNMDVLALLYFSALVKKADITQCVLGKNVVVIDPVNLLQHITLAKQVDLVTKVLNCEYVLTFCGFPSFKDLDNRIDNIMKVVEAGREVQSNEWIKSSRKYNKR